MKFPKDTALIIVFVWPLLFGIFMIMMGSGLQGTLLSLRADLSGFPISVIGIIMSLYYCGYLAGWFIVPTMINSVGHIRVFAGFASMASTTILLQGLYVDPYIWSIIRVLSGISFVGLFIVAESWLNDVATNETRGQIIGAYLFMLHAGLFGGQFLINLAPIDQIDLFIFVSILISLSLIPITLSNKSSPAYQEPEQLPFLKLVKISPYSVLCVFSSGFTWATILTMGPVYAKDLGLEISDIAWLIAIFVLGCGTIPFFVGWLSDRMDRRKIMIAIAFFSFILTALAAGLPDMLPLLLFLLGGGVISIYSVASALLNDRLKPSQRTSAIASLILINGMSACLGPIITGTMMQTFGNSVFFMVFCAIFLVVFAYGLFRAYVGPSIDIDAQDSYQILPVRGTPALARLRRRARGKKT